MPSSSARYSTPVNKLRYKNVCILCNQQAQLFTNNPAEATKSTRCQIIWLQTDWRPACSNQKSHGDDWALKLLDAWKLYRIQNAEFLLTYRHHSLQPDWAYVSLQITLVTTARFGSRRNVVPLALQNSFWARESCNDWRCWKKELRKVRRKSTRSKSQLSLSSRTG